MAYYLVDVADKIGGQRSADAVVVQASNPTDARAIAVKFGGALFAESTTTEIPEPAQGTVGATLTIRKTGVNRTFTVAGLQSDRNISDLVSRLRAAINAVYSGTTYNGKTKVLTIPASASVGDALITCDLTYQGATLAGSAPTVSAAGVAASARTATFPAAVIAGVAATVQGRVELATPLTSLKNLEPVKDWRFKALAAYDSGSSSTLVANLIAGLPTSTALSINQGATRTIAFKVPTLPYELMFFWQAAQINATWSMSQSYSLDSTDGSNGTWSDDVAGTVHRPNAYLVQQKIMIPAGQARWVRVKITNGGSAGARTINEVAIFRMLPNVRLDYWVMLGASLTDYPGDYNLWRTQIAAKYPGRNPVIFNHGVAGETASQIMAHIDTDLAAHPRASFVTIDGFMGNDVTNGRPYSGLSGGTITTLTGYVNTACDKVEAMGATPIVSNLSYREYTTGRAIYNNAFPLEGSQPYNVNILDVVRAARSPEFNVDMYAHVLADGRVLTDSTHMTPAGLVAWRDEWIDTAFRRVYNRQIRQSARKRRTALVNFGNNASLSYNYCTNYVETEIGVGNLKPLIDTEGNYTQWQCEVTDAFPGGAETGMDTGANSGRYPDALLKGFWYTDTTNTAGAVKVTGLNPKRTYDIRVIGSRNAVAADRIGQYVVAGARTERTQELDGASNTANIVEWLCVQPNLSGEITVTMNTKAASTFAYFGVLDISENGELAV